MRFMYASSTLLCKAGALKTTTASVANESKRLVCSGSSGRSLNLLRKLALNGLKCERRRCVMDRSGVGGRRETTEERTFSRVTSSSLYSSVSGSSSIALHNDVKQTSERTCQPLVIPQRLDKTCSLCKRSTHFLRFSMASSGWSRRNCATPIRSDARRTQAFG